MERGRRWGGRRPDQQEGGGGKKSRDASGKRKAKRREIERAGKREKKRESNGAAEIVGKTRRETKSFDTRYRARSVELKFLLDGGGGTPSSSRFLSALERNENAHRVQARHRVHKIHWPRPVLASWFLQFLQNSLRNISGKFTYENNGLNFNFKKFKYCV